MNPLDDINTAAQAAEFLKTSEWKLQQLAKNGEIGYIKIGNTRTYPRGALLDFVAENTTPVVPANPHGLSSVRPQRGSRSNSTK
ncbi:MAG: DNA-binding protein [Glaciihabitans sp.]|nr:DNA-binding protein [Glaciihabitans sp.]